ncbi:MAG: RNA polymerase subunit sigma-70 [Flavobacteriales bacterium CG_4_9_14_3_um_filter_40_17]|nr:MAG: RNA polymerase subunit sigma-70 [Flavobacteriales bacterium CG_4_9_14_3_um_filter_40_17]
MEHQKPPLLNPNMWHDLYFAYLFNYTVVRVSDKEISKDLVQETFFSALKAIDNFKGKSSERTWLIAILKRKIIDYYRKKNTKKGKSEIKIAFNDDRKNEADWLEECVADCDLISNAESMMVNAELGTTINKCIGLLPEKQAVIFRMKFIECFETDMICELLGITRSNLWVSLHRAKFQLRNHLEKSRYA